MDCFILEGNSNRPVIFISSSPVYSKIIITSLQQDVEILQHAVKLCFNKKNWNVLFTILNQWYIGIVQKDVPLLYHIPIVLGAVFVSVRGAVVDSLFMVLKYVKNPDSNTKLDGFWSILVDDMFSWKRLMKWPKQNMQIVHFLLNLSRGCQWMNHRL